jgi:hypothetical protein
MTGLQVAHEEAVLWQAGDSRVFRVPSGRAARRGSVGVLSRSMFERPDRTLAGGFKRDVGCLFFGYLLLATQKKVTRPPGGTGYED